MARWASFIDSRRADTPVLLLDTGDFFRPEASEEDEIDYRYFFEGMRLMRYDAVNIGPNDILYGTDRLRNAANEGGLPLVSSNIVDRRDDCLIARPYIIKYLGGRRTLFGMREGVRVGIFGVTDPSFFELIDSSISKNYKIKDPRITALEAVSVLKKKGCDLIIAISHLGWEKSVSFASDVPGMDIVINGRRGHEGTYQKHAGSTIIVDTGIHRISFTEIEARFFKGRLFLKATDMGGAARNQPERADLLKLESRYGNELKIKGIEDRREKAVEIE
ncbi:MAG: hypothetical protein JW746_05995 [Candidatus Krumholzibacteriota bacterium]|nr:hypothetical protein [Candidatus Krumholzibacteriota bacterium]